MRGLEIDSSARINGHVTVYGAAAYTDAIYVSFPDAPPPFEETGGPTSKDISGAILPGVSKWSGSFGGEFSHAGHVHRPARTVLRRRRHQRPHLVLVERDPVEVSDD